jgi:Tol biopolymer transport system component
LRGICFSTRHARNAIFPGETEVVDRRNRLRTVVGLAVFLSLARTHGETTLEEITRDPGLATDPALSLDGKLLAYASDRGAQSLNIWVKQLTGDDRAVQLTHAASDAHQPSFSPDGSRIAYRSEQDGGGVDVIPAIGGEALRVAPEGRDPRFSPDGRWIAYWVGRVSGPTPDADAAGAVFVIPASGGEPKRMGRELPPGGYPVWSPDSKQLLLYANSRNGPPSAGADWWIVSREDGRPRKTGAFARLKSQGFSFQFASGLPRASAWVGNTVVFSAQKGDGRNIWQIRFSADSLGSDTAARITLGTEMDVYPSSIGQGGFVFASLKQNLAIWSLPIRANEGRVSGDLRKLTDGTASEVTPSISADGRTLVYGSTAPNREDIWLKDLQTGKERPVANTAAAEWHPTITRDGSMIAYTVDEGGARAIYVAPISGGRARKVTTESGWVFDWTLDKQHLLFRPGSYDSNLRSLNLETGLVSDFLKKSGVNLYQSKLSPDGGWLVFEAVIRTGDDGNPDARLFVVKTENGLPASGADWILVSDEHGRADKPRWSPDGNTLYYLSDRDGFLCLWAQRLAPATKRPISPPFPIYHFHTSRLSPKNVGTALLEIDVAKDKLVMNMGELTGNVWKLRRQ